MVLRLLLMMVRTANRLPFCNTTLDVELVAQPDVHPAFWLPQAAQGGGLPDGKPLGSTKSRPVVSSVGDVIGPSMEVDRVTVRAHVGNRLGPRRTGRLPSPGCRYWSHPARTRMLRW